MDYKVVKSCRICGSTNFHKYLDLGVVPACNALLDSRTQEEPKYPIEVLLCKDCFLSQLSVVVEPTVLYNNYPYHSSVSETFKKHCYDMALTLKAMWSPSPKPEWFLGSNEAWVEKQRPRVLDIASNDGCLLKQFRRAGFYILGVEPAKNLNNILFDNLDKFTQDECVDNLVPVIPRFWSSELAEDLNYKRLRPWGEYGEGQIDFITATNVFAHVDDLTDFLNGINIALKPNGIFVVEVPHLLSLIENNQFDTIYHEHLSYFLLGPLRRLFDKHGLPIFRVERLPIHGGSLRIYTSKDFYPEESSVEEIGTLEIEHNLYDVNTYDAFTERVKKSIQTFRTLMELFYVSGKKVMAYGASAKGISLLNYTDVDTKYIHSIVDDTPAKQNKFTPGSKLPIVGNSHFEFEKPDLMLLLAWNFAEELMAKTKSHKERGGYYLVPIPELRLV